MRRNYLVPILTLLLAVGLISALLATQKAENGFSCYTYDDQGRIINGYWSENEEMWYLFLTSTQNVLDVQLYCTEEIVGTSAGTLAQNVVMGGFRASEDKVELILSDGTMQTIVVLQSTLPCVYIDLAQAELADIHNDKDQKFDYNSLYISDPAGAWNLVAEDSVQIKGRGNSTWTLSEKRGYQISFEQETSVLGMSKAKKWILLANAFDDSMMRSQLVYTMAEKMEMDFVPSFEYVDLWIDGEYRGLYMLGEKVEIGTSRLDLKQPTGALFEHDEFFYMGEKNWFLSKKMNRHFTLKEIVEKREQVIQAAITNFEFEVDELIQYLYETPSEDVTLLKLSRMIDVDSFIQYFLINEYSLNREAFVVSFFWYKDGLDDVLHLGPVWDFDTCMGNDGELYTADYGEKNHELFRYLLAAPAFYERTLELLEEYWEHLSSMTDDVETISEEIARSAKMNYIRWDVLGKPNPKGGTDFARSFDEAVDILEQWLRGREGGFQVTHSKVAASVVSDDCKTMTVFLQLEEECESVRIALWSFENGQDDLNWYLASKEEVGTWRCRINLERHNCAGVYYYHIYADNQQSPIATGRNYVEIACSVPRDLRA